MGKFGRQKLSHWKRKERRQLYNEVGGILPIMQFPLGPTLYIISVKLSVFLRKEEGIW